MSLPDLVLSMADNKQMLGLRYAEWATRAPSLEDVAASPKIYSLYIMYTIAQTVIKTGTSLTRYGNARNIRAVAGCRRR